MRKTVEQGSVLLTNWHRASQRGSALTRLERVSGEGGILRRLSRGGVAGAGRHRTSTTRACVHEGLLLMRRADCIRILRGPASEKTIQNAALRISGPKRCDNDSVSHLQRHPISCIDLSFALPFGKIRCSRKIILVLLNESIDFRFEWHLKSENLHKRGRCLGHQQ